MNDLSWLEDDLLSRVAWNRLADPGDTTAGTLRERAGIMPALREILLATRPGAQAGELRARWAGRISLLDPCRDVHNGKLIGARVLLPHEPGWPLGLADLGTAAPVCLWARGSAVIDWERTVALVGSRASTSYGNRVTAEIAAGVAQAGVSVISGGAYGIDGAAHRAALAVSGSTVAILAGGLDRLYPKAHDRLLAEIGAHHLLLSEAAPGVAPTRWRFLERNRLIAATCRATVVVEAAWRSGAINTARHAGTIGRPLGAVPGPVTSMSSAGCHYLMREHYATCITDAADTLELAGLGPGTDHRADPPMDPVDLRVYDALAPGRVLDVLTLAQLAALPPNTVTAALGRLSLTDDVRRRDHGWSRRPLDQHPRRA